MNLNEHQSKRLFAELGIAVPDGLLLRPNDVADCVPPFPFPWMLKAQVLAGGRGKAGGIVSANSLDEFKVRASALFQLTIKGEIVPLVRIEPKADIAREFYLSISVSRPRHGFVFTIGRHGGIDVESLDTGNLLIQDIHCLSGPADHQIRRAFFHLKINKTYWPEFETLVRDLFTGVFNKNLLLAEINPLVLTTNHQWLALDGKVEVDDNILSIKNELLRFNQIEHSAKEENQAREQGLSFHKLTGSVGMMVNGAGLAMATMDMLDFSGVKAANFLDLGGGADEPRMTTALNLLFNDSSVQVILVNIFGGILSCAKVAQALASVLNCIPPKKPMVIRLAGNGAAEGLALIAGLALPDLHVAEDLEQALKLVTTLVPKNCAKLTILQADPPSIFTTTQESKPFPPPGEPRNFFGLSSYTPVLIQGITGREGQLHTRLMQECGTKIVAGVTPFKGGGNVLGIPLYDTVAGAAQAHSIGASVIFVPAAMAADAILEAAANDIPWIICITEGIPQADMLTVTAQLKESKSRLIGPNTPGLFLPQATQSLKLGIMPASVFRPGPVAVLSRSGTLTYEAVDRLSRAGIGQSLALGIGGDPFVGSTFADILPLLDQDSATKAVLLLGEIGGTAEEDAAACVRWSGFSKPVLAFIAGRTAPPGKRLGHAGAILEGGKNGINMKLEALRSAGCRVCDRLDEIAPAMVRALNS